MAEEKKRSPMIDQTRMRLAEYERQVWVANVEFGLTVEDIMVPGFWAHMAAQLRPYDEIEARSDDGTWIAHLVVTGCERTWARVAIDRVVKLTTKEVAEAQSNPVQHKVEWKGPQNKFSVIRIADAEPIRTGFTTKDEALQYLRDHERTIGVVG
jgi:hypothetical protein